MNRLKELLEEPEEEARCGDFWVITTNTLFFYVSAETAQKVARRLERWRVPRWVTFMDIAGSRVRLRGCDVLAIYESTELQRQRDRSFQRARQLEDQADRRSWENED